MKKLIALILVLIMLTFTSCEYLPSELLGVIEMGKVHTVSFTAGYDYGFHEEGRATLLLSGSSIFFDTDEWEIGRINAGDVITVEYRGELLIQETYPGVVVTKNAEIISITAHRADVIELIAEGTEDDPVIRTVSGEDIRLIPTDAGTETTMVIDEDGSFRQLCEAHLDGKIYATGKLGDGSFEVRAFYGFDPRNPAKQ